MKKIPFLFILCLGALCFPGNSQNMQYNPVLPVVFEIGEFEPDYETLINTHEDLLLDACSGDMSKAYHLWMNMIHEMEILAKEEGLDIEGVKIWLNAFWNEKGQLEHLVFHLKPNSAPVDLEKFSSFLLLFSDNFVLPVEHNNTFSHFGSASFPSVLY